MALCTVGFMVTNGCIFARNTAALKESGFALKEYKAAPGSDATASKWTALVLVERRQRFWKYIVDIFQLSSFEGVLYCFRISPLIPRLKDVFHKIPLVMEDQEKAEVMGRVTFAYCGFLVGLNTVALMFHLLEFLRTFMDGNGVAGIIKKAATDVQNCSLDKNAVTQSKDYCCNTAATQTEELTRKKVQLSL